MLRTSEKSLMAEGRSLGLSNDDMKEILEVTKASHPTETPVDEILKRMKEDMKELLKVSNASRPAVIFDKILREEETQEEFNLLFLHSHQKAFKKYLAEIHESIQEYLLHYQRLDADIWTSQKSSLEEYSRMISVTQNMAALNILLLNSIPTNFGEPKSLRTSK